MWCLEGENDSPLYLMSSTGLWRHNWSTIQNMTLKYVYFFEWHQSGAKSVNLFHCYAGEIKLNARFTSQSKSKQTCQMAPSSIWTRKYSTYRQQRTGGNVVLGNEDDNPNKTCWIQLFIPISLLVNAEVLVLVIIVAVCRAPDHSSLLSTATPSDTECQKRGIKTILLNLCYNTNLVCFAKTVSPAPVTRYSYRGKWHNMVTHIYSV